MTMPEALTAKELADLKLKRVPHTERALQLRADREGWTREARQGRGGGWVYPIATLPAPIRDAIVAHYAKAQLPAVKPAAQVVAAAPVDATQLATWQRRTFEARSAILQHIDGLSMLSGSWRRAALQVAELAQAGQLPPYLQQLVPAANARAGADGARTLSLRSLQRWHSERDAGGTTALAPAARPEPEVPAWAPHFLKLYRIPSKPSIAESLERLAEHLPAPLAMPSYDQVKRFLKRMDTVERNRGRMGPRELKSIRPYVARDTSELWPLDVVSADGHTFDAEVAHPIHGRPFRPEITAIIDYATRACVGWSASLAENAFGVAEAIGYMVTRHGIPAIWYVDNGKGYNNKFMASEELPEVCGLLGRLGITKHNSIAYNSQARGLIERSHQSIWVRGAKRLETYMGAAMDKEARNKVYKLTRAAQKAGVRSPLLMTWEDFLAWAQQQVDAYNRRPHSSLPHTIDPETGKKRHQSPSEAWNAALKDGWEPMLVSAAEADDLYRPYEERTVSRGQVSVLGNTYFARELEPWNGERVLVGYDIHQAEKVWVRTLEGKLICTAAFEANKRSLFARTAVAASAETRAKGKERRLMEHLDEVHEELRPNVIDLKPAVPEPLPAPAAAIHRQLIEQMAKPAPQKALAPKAAASAPAAPVSHVPETPAARYDRWLEVDTRIRAGGDVADRDRTWWERYQATSEFRGQQVFRKSFETEQQTG